METATILYDIQHFSRADYVVRIVNKVKNDTDIPIDMNIVDGCTLLDKLASNPNYDFVILHMGGETEGAYVQADKCRKLSNSVLVAESVMYPFGVDEVGEYFDEYIDLFSDYNLRYLLEKYGFVEDAE